MGFANDLWTVLLPDDETKEQEALDRLVEDDVAADVAFAIGGSHAVTHDEALTRWTRFAEDIGVRADLLLNRIRDIAAAVGSAFADEAALLPGELAASPASACCSTGLTPARSPAWQALADSAGMAVLRPARGRRALSAVSVQYCDRASAHT